MRQRFLMRGIFHRLATVPIGGQFMIQKENDEIFSRYLSGTFGCNLPSNLPKDQQRLMLAGLPYSGVYSKVPPPGSACRHNLPISFIPVCRSRDAHEQAQAPKLAATLDVENILEDSAPKR